MPTNYKYVKKEGAKRKKRRIRILGPFLLFLSLVLLTYGLFFFLTRKTDELILVGQYRQAIDTLDHWKWLPLANASVYEEIGTAELLTKGGAKAEVFFRKSSSKLFFKPIPIWKEVLKILWAQGRYADGLFYTNHIQAEVAGDQIFHFYRAGFLAGENKLNEASKELKKAGNSPEYRNEISILRTEINQRLTTGHYTFLFDREKYPLVNISLEGKTEILYDQIAPIVTGPHGDYLEKLKTYQAKQFVLTIDQRIQNAALNALGKYAGAIVLLDVKTGNILAAASKLKGKGSEYTEPVSLALNRFYEPGSIIKLITLAGALEHGIDLNQIFPLECIGYLPLSGDKILYDWTVHGEVKDIYNATAVSCNIAFARIGLAMKPAIVLSNLKKFGFNSKLLETFLPLDLGYLTQGDGTDSYLSNLSIGLEFLEMTPLHAALLASAIGKQGVAMLPQLLLGTQNILGLSTSKQPPVEYQRFMTAKTAKILTEGMQQVLFHPEGTGRRARIENFPYALKTGTAGDREKGYDAILIGFAPLPEPKIAFSVFVEHSGKAELEGTRVTKQFLESIRNYVQ